MGAEVEQAGLWGQDNKITGTIHTFCSAQETPSVGALEESCLPSGWVWKPEQQEGKALNIAPCNIQHHIQHEWRASKEKKTGDILYSVDDITF